MFKSSRFLSSGMLIYYEISHKTNVLSSYVKFVSEMTPLNAVKHSQEGFTANKKCVFKRPYHGISFNLPRKYEYLENKFEDNRKTWRRRGLVNVQFPPPATALPWHPWISAKFSLAVKLGSVLKIPSTGTHNIISRDLRSCCFDLECVTLNLFSSQ